jgi:hypothetical protein
METWEDRTLTHRAYWSQLNSQKASNQAWLYAQLMNLLAEVFTFDVYSTFRNFQEGRERKRKQHDEKLTGRENLVEVGGYLEKLAAKLNFEDIDPKASLPSSFNDYLHRK